MFPFKCKTMKWANNRIRTVYNSAVGLKRDSEGEYIEKFQGITWNSSMVGDNFDPFEHGVKSGENVNVTDFFYLNRISYYSNGFKYKPSHKMDGCNSTLAIMTTDNAT